MLVDRPEFRENRRDGRRGYETQSVVDWKQNAAISKHLAASFVDIYVIKTLNGHASSIESCALDWHEEICVAGAASGSVKLWDLDHAKGWIMC